MKQFTILFVLVTFLGVGVKNCSHRVQTNPSTMYFEVDKNFNHVQLDSAFQSEGLPPLQYWMDGTSFVDNEDEIVISQWLYIQSDSIFYILTDLDTIANFKKRVIRTRE